MCVGGAYTSKYARKARGQFCTTTYVISHKSQMFPTSRALSAAVASDCIRISAIALASEKYRTPELSRNIFVCVMLFSRLMQLRLVTDM